MRFLAVFGMFPEICFAFDSETIKTPKNSTLFSAVSSLDTIGGGGGKMEKMGTFSHGARKKGEYGGQKQCEKRVCGSSVRPLR